VYSRYKVAVIYKLPAILPKIVEIMLSEILEILGLISTLPKEKIGKESLRINLKISRIAVEQNCINKKMLDFSSIF
jgi:hypothetical protein